MSGGPDSTCLLLALASLRNTLGFELEAAHFDHGLRGRRAANMERRFAEELSTALEVSLRTGAGDVGQHARKGRCSIEEAARELRYRFLADAARETNCSVVATGHTKDDQAETVLLHLLRGSGLRGLGAMAPTSAWPFPGHIAGDLRLVRPLLDITRNEVDRCCQHAGLEPIDDPSNRSAEHLRNRVRRELVPDLQTYNPRIVDALAGLAASARNEVEVIEQLSKDLVEERGGAALLDRRRLVEAPLGLRAHAVRRGYGIVAGDARQLGQRHVAAVLNAADGPTGATLDLPRGVHVEVRRNSIAFTNGAGPWKPALPARAVELSVPGTTAFGPWRFEAQIVRSPSRIDGDPLVASFDVEATSCGLSVRRRRDGDRFQPLGMARAKKLQDFFVDEHVPRKERDAVPLVCNERGIVWVVGRRPAEWAKVRSGARRVLRVRAVLGGEISSENLP